jgi:FdhE protein
MAAAEALLQRLDRRLAVLCTQHPELEGALTLQRDIIRAQLDSSRPPEVTPFPLSRPRLNARIDEGVPLLHDQPVSLDLHFAADLFSRLLNALADRGSSAPTDGLDELMRAATSGRLDPEHIFGEAFVQHADHLGQIAAGAGVSADLLAAMASLAVAPILRAYAERLLPFLDQAEDGAPDRSHWSRGYCPICGAWPLLAEVRAVDQPRWLRCGQCGSSWRDQGRPLCAYCGNGDERSLGTLTLDGELRFHAALCQRCKGYLKVGNTLEPPTAELLAIDDVASLQLDLAATERGYVRPSGSGYRLELAVPEDEWLEELT